MARPPNPGGGRGKSSLDNLMMAYTDLSTPGKGSSFKGPALKDVQVSKAAKPSFQTSSKSRDWSSLSQNLEDAFAGSSATGIAGATPSLPSTDPQTNTIPFQPQLVSQQPAPVNHSAAADDWGDFQSVGNSFSNAPSSSISSLIGAGIHSPVGLPAQPPPPSQLLSNPSSLNSISSVFPGQAAFNSAPVLKNPNSGVQVPAFPSHNPGIGCSVPAPVSQAPSNLEEEEDDDFSDFIAAAAPPPPPVVPKNTNTSFQTPIPNTGISQPSQQTPVPVSKYLDPNYSLFPPPKASVVRVKENPLNDDFTNFASSSSISSFSAIPRNTAAVASNQITPPIVNSKPISSTTSIAPSSIPALASKPVYPSPSLPVIQPTAAFAASSSSVLKPIPVANSDDKYGVFREVFSSEQKPDAATTAKEAAEEEEDEFGDFIESSASSSFAATAPSNQPVSAPASGPASLQDVFSSLPPMSVANPKNPAPDNILASPTSPSRAPPPPLSSKISNPSLFGSVFMPQPAGSSNVSSNVVPWLADSPPPPPDVIDEAPDDDEFGVLGGGTGGAGMSSLHGFHDPLDSILDPEPSLPVLPAVPKESSKSPPPPPAPVVDSLDIPDKLKNPGGDTSATSWSRDHTRNSSSSSLNLKISEDPGSLDGPQVLDPNRYSDLYELSSSSSAGRDLAKDWTLALEEIKNLLAFADKTFKELVEDDETLEDVLDSQGGEDYLRNLTEIYQVSAHIKVSAQSRSELAPDVKDLIASVEDLWDSLRKSCRITDPASSSSQNNGIKCGVCLDGIGAEQVSLCYGPGQYHAGCANFWVNRVRLTLPYHSGGFL